jgi:polar amino acid transport system ATP-binding protein
MSSSIRLKGVRKRYGELEVLRGIDLEIPAGQTVSVIGPSGSGKSTLLRLLMTLEQPDDGVIEIDGESLWTTTHNGAEVPASRAHVRRVRGKIGMVFQHFNLFPHMTVLGNVIEAPIHVAGLSRAEAIERAREYLEMVGLQDKLDAYPGNLSGGQKQRVGIARALAMRPGIMLFDEVTSALDPELVGGILNIMRDLASRREMTMLIVTHQMKFAERSSDRTLFFDQGNIVEDAPSDQLFAQPAHERTRQFLEAVVEDA